jgi:hypothetical protein
MKRSRFGIVAWTAARFIGQNPQASKREVKEHLETTLGRIVNVGMLFAPHDPSRRRRGMRSTTMNVLWVREMGQCRISGRRVWVHTLTDRGHEVAESERPPTHEEAQRLWHERKRREPHEADWVRMVDPGELFAVRKKTTWGGTWVYGFQHSDHDSPTIRLSSDEIFILIDGISLITTRYCCDRQRFVNDGRVQVLTGDGQMIWMVAGHLKPIKGTRRINTNSDR